MQIDPNILIAYGGFIKKQRKGSFVYLEGGQPYFYYQVLEGEVKVFHSNDEVRELVHGIFRPGDSFGESALLLNKPYASTAQACSNSVIIKIARENLFHIFSDYPELMKSMLFTFATRIYHKSITTQILFSSTPEERITRLFIDLKKNTTGCGALQIPYTRQQIADLTGLRVETVIRTLMRMSEAGKVTIIKHKVHY